MSHDGHDMPMPDHGGHDMPGMEPMCNMQMLWNTDIIDTCIVFPSWHIRSHAQFVWSFVAIVALGVFYEWIRGAQHKLDRRIAAALAAHGKGKATLAPAEADTDADAEDAGLLTGVPVSKARAGTPVPFAARIARAALYGATVFLSFFLMLVFMTYNAYLIVAVVLGAAIGHFTFASHIDVQATLYGTADGKGMACH